MIIELVIADGFKKEFFVDENEGVPPGMDFKRRTIEKSLRVDEVLDHLQREVIPVYERLGKVQITLIFQSRIETIPDDETQSTTTD